MYVNLVNWHVKIEGIQELQQFRNDGMTSHRDVMTRRCDMLAAACKNSSDDLFDTNNPN